MHTGTTNTGNMDFMQMMQTQILTFTSMKNDGNMMQAVIGIIILTLVNNFIKVLPIIWSSIEKYAAQYLKKKKNDYLSNINVVKSINGITKTRKGNILFEKTSVSGDEEIVLALIRHISNLKTSKNILFNRDFFVINTEEFIIEPEVYCSVLTWNKDDKGNIAQYSFEIYSYEYNVERLKEIVDRIVEEYKQDKANNLGKQPYYFNEICIPIPKNIDGTYRYEAAQRSFIFDMTPFYTNKSLSNVFGSHLNIVKKRVDMFINNPMWYQRKGIPHTLGILLSGPPGTGKTSAIKAIANDTGRHIFNISLSKMTTQTQLKKLFYSTEVKVLKNGANEIVHIPIDKRIYVMEDIDVLGDIVLDRRIIKTTTSSNTSSNTLPNTTPISEIPRTVSPRTVSPIQKSKQSISSNTNNNTNTNTNNDNNDNDNDNNDVYNLMNDNMAFSNSGYGGTSLSDAFAEPNMIRQPDRSYLISDLPNSKSIIKSDTVLTNNIYKRLNTSLNDYDTLSVKSNNSINSENNQDYNQDNKDNLKKDKSDIDENNKNPEEITLSFLLNLLDGVLETPGRIVIMTSNHPERLDPALVRPGRIDINLRVGYCSRDMVIDMFRFFYDDNTIEINETEWEYNKEITPAELSAILQNNFDNFIDAKIELINKTT